MKKFNRDYAKGFVSGITAVAATGIILGSTVAFASGVYSTIKVYSGDVKMYVDGKLTIPTDGNGNKVEPLIYDGTTYLPARALSNALTDNSKAVSWDGKTKSMYIGQAPVAEQTDIANIEYYGELSDYGMYFQTGSDAKFEILDKTITPFNSAYVTTHYGCYTTYMLHSNYSSLKGEFVIPYTVLGASGDSTVYFYNVDKYGTETLIESYTTEIGDDPVDIDVDLSGVNILKIKGDSSTPYSYYNYHGKLYNVILEGIN